MWLFLISHLWREPSVVYVQVAYEVCVFRAGICVLSVDDWFILWGHRTHSDYQLILVVNQILYTAVGSIFAKTCRNSCLAAGARMLVDVFYVLYQTLTKIHGRNYLR